MIDDLTHTALAVTKDTVLRILNDIGLLLELKGENPFKSRAYYQAARALEKESGDIADLVATGAISSIKSIGPAIAKKLTELVTTGRLDYYEQLKASIPPGCIEMLKAPGLGPKKIHILCNVLGIATLSELEQACRENRLLDLPGFGQKTQEKILAGIEQVKSYRDRYLYASVAGRAEELTGFLRVQEGVTAVETAGSLRRLCETVKDIDVVAASAAPEILADAFAAMPSVAQVTAKGATKVSVRLFSGIAADLRIVSPGQFPYALHHFTGSKDHNTALRGRAKRMGFKLNEYGLFEGERLIHCSTEEELFGALGLCYIPPELREAMGEIEAAEGSAIPDLIDMKDVKGLLHVHTDMSDGSDSLERIVSAARAMGLSYIGIADHSISAAYAGGLSEEAVKRQHALIDEIMARHPSPHIFKGIEAEILADGSLDFSDDILETFDFVIAAVHSHFSMSAESMTNRILTALDNPLTAILAHPTGRLLLARKPYAVDIDRVIDRAVEHSVAIELNANPLRLDLDWRQIRQALEKGALIAINPDSHRAADLKDIRFGLNIARKGWMTPKHCLNCLDVKEIGDVFSRKRNRRRKS